MQNIYQDIPEVEYQIFLYFCIFHLITNYYVISILKKDFVISFMGLNIMFERQHPCFDFFSGGEDFTDGISEFQCDRNAITIYTSIVI